MENGVRWSMDKGEGNFHFEQFVSGKTGYGTGNYGGWDAKVKGQRQ